MSSLKCLNYNLPSISAISEFTIPESRFETAWYRKATPTDTQQLLYFKSYSNWLLSSGLNS